MVKDTGKQLPLSLKVGQIFGGHYSLMQMLGSGGVGVIFLAKDAILGRFVVIKVLRKEIATQMEQNKMFRKEARLLSCFSHPNVVSIYEFGQDQPSGLHYIVMEYVDGHSLEHSISGYQPLDAMLFYQAMRMIGDAIKEAHRHGIVHLDLKPLNVLINSTPKQDLVIKVIDFGLAKVFDTTKIDAKQKWDSYNNQIEGSDGMGSPPYMAPEQYAGENIDWRADIYALGVMACELLTGHLPFVANNRLQFWYAKEHGEPQRPSELNPPLKITAEIDAVICRAMAKRPADRYQDVEEFISALLAALDRWRPQGEAKKAQPLQAVSAPHHLHPLQLALRAGPDVPPPLKEEIRGKQAARLVAVLVLRLEIRPGEKNEKGSERGKGALDLEEYSEHLRVLASRIEQVVASYRGVVLSPLSGAQTFLFGLGPGEDDIAERAIDSALGVREALRALRKDPMLQTPFEGHFSLGLDVGRLLLVDDGYGRCLVQGLPLAIAHRLAEGVAQDEIYISHAIYRQIKGDLHYHLRPLAHTASENTLQFIVEKRRRYRAHFAPLPLYGVSVPCCGREVEIEQLKGVLQEVIEKQCAQIVHITGPQGIGKTRLVQEFFQYIDALESPLVICEQGCCYSGANTSLHEPFIGILRNRMGIDELDSHEVIRYKIKLFFCQWINHNPSFFDDEESRLLECINRILGVYQPNPQESSKPLQAQEITKWLSIFYMRLLNVYPLMLVLDDFQHATPQFTQMIEALHAFAKDAPVLIVLISRTEQGASPTRQPPAAVHLPLLALTSGQSRGLLQSILRYASSVPHWFIDQVIDLARGIPLIIEETVRDMVDRGAICIEQDHWHWINPETPVKLGVPKTIERLLLNLIERIPTSLRALLDVASVCGQSFWPSLLQAAHAQEGVVQCLKELEAQGVITALEASSFNREPAYRFTHQAHQQFLYHSLPRSRRRSIHSVVALWLQQHLPQLGAAWDVLIGHHFSQADNFHQALFYTLSALRRSARRPPFTEALTLLEQCHKTVHRSRLFYLPSASLPTLTLALEALATFAQIQLLCGDVQACVLLAQETLALCVPPLLPADLACHKYILSLNLSLCEALRLQGRYDVSLQYLSLPSHIEASTLATDPQLLLRFTVAHAELFLSLNNPAQAAQLLNQNLPPESTPKTSDWRRLRSRMVRLIGDSELAQGHHEKAHASFQRAQKLALAAEAPLESIEALLSLGALSLSEQRVQQAAALWEDALQTATELGFAFQRHEILLCLSECQLLLNDPTRALALAQESLLFFESTQSYPFVLRALSCLTHGFLLLNSFEQALACATRALLVATEHSHHPELLRVSLLVQYLARYLCTHPLCEAALRRESLVLLANYHELLCASELEHFAAPLRELLARLEDLLAEEPQSDPSEPQSIFISTSDLFALGLPDVSEDLNTSTQIHTLIEALPPPSSEGLATDTTTNQPIVAAAKRIQTSAALDKLSIDNEDTEKMNMRAMREKLRLSLLSPALMTPSRKI